MSFFLEKFSSLTNVILCGLSSLVAASPMPAFVDVSYFWEAIHAKCATLCSGVQMGTWYLVITILCGGSPLNISIRHDQRHYVNSTD